MDAAAELGRNSVSKQQIRPEYGDEQADAGRDCRTRVARQIIRQGNINFPCSADHVQDWQSYPVDPYSCCMCDHTRIVVNPAYGHVKRKNDFFMSSPRSSLSVYGFARDRFGCPVPRQPVLLLFFGYNDKKNWTHLHLSI